MASNPQLLKRLLEETAPLSALFKTGMISYVEQGAYFHAEVVSGEYIVNSTYLEDSESPKNLVNVWPL